MADDLVKRLRELNTFEWHARPATTKEVCFEAADHIEKLEDALRRIIDRAEYRMGHHVTDAVCAIARETLGNKND